MITTIHIALLLCACTAHADTIVNFDFDDPADLQTHFNPDSAPYVFNQSTGGIENSGVVNSGTGQNSADIWTSRTAYSITGPGDSYRLSAFFRLSDARGHSGIGIATSDVNEPIGSGNTASGIGYITTDEVITVVSSTSNNPTAETFEYRFNEFEFLFSNSWYHFEVTILTKPEGTFDVSIAISDSDTSGNIGSVVTTFSQTGIVNNDLAQASKVHPYFSINATSGSRFDRVDNLSMRLSGGPVVVSDPTADSDDDGDLDVTDSDDDGDGTNDEDDAFPLDENENSDNDNDGIGDEADNDDDNDGQIDSEDSTPNGGPEIVDTDSDGVPDSDDRFPNDASESQDSDNDGTGDNADRFPNDPSETSDTDNDGTGNNTDAFPNDPTETEDSDNDGTGDNADAFPNDPTETEDSDNDGTGDNADAFPSDPTETVDSDNDGTGDNSDAFPNDPTETVDSDNDGTGDNADAFPSDPTETEDSDNDGTGDNSDAFPNDPTETVDSDNDGTGDNADTFPSDPTETKDSDNDGTGDNADAFPNDPTETKDSDNDGTGDNADAFPNDPTETKDSDNDGTGDNADAFPNDPTETKDSDNDGTGDNADAFPNDPTETKDSDNDGIGDNADAFPNNPNEYVDSDGDGIGDNADDTPLGEIPPNAQDTDNDGVENSKDAFPEDASEWLDSDGDGVGDNADRFDNDATETRDSDGDGTGDNADVFPLDENEQSDIDSDGIGDNADLDNDNDGAPDNVDFFPRDPNEQLDTDFDGIGNNADTDDDGDGVTDENDAFPLLASESLDSDADGVGNNADLDDDNDGTVDGQDSFPLDATEFRDSDSDGVGNNADADDDNDGYSDIIESVFGSSSLNASSIPVGLDIDRDSLADSIERGSDADGDGIGNEFDVDSDNDGIFDLLEASESPALAALLDVNNDGMIDTGGPGSLTHRVNIPVDTDGDAIRDYRDLDSDNDGLTDTAETQAPNSGFTVINSLQNDQSVRAQSDPDGDSLVNYRDLDSDNDGVPDIVEAGGLDVDDNGLADDFLDLNADGMDDAYFMAPLILRDTDADGQQDYVDLDSNNDGQFDLVASGLINADLNGDGRLDVASDSDGDGVSDYADVDITNGPDIDNDGIDDRLDASVRGEPDTDMDGIADAFDADAQGDGFVQVASIKLPDVTTPSTSTPSKPAATNPQITPPETSTMEPVILTPELGTAVATTSITGSGCSVSGATQPDMVLAAMLIFSVVYLTLLKLGTFRTLKSALLMFLSLSLAAGPTMADVQTGLYLGIGGGASRLMPGIEYARVDERDSVGAAWNATAGYQLSRKVGVEFEYSNLGSTTLDPLGSIDYNDINVSGLYHRGGIANGQDGRAYSLFGRLGFGKINNQSNIQLRNSGGTHWLAGAGVQIPLGSQLSLRGEGIYYAEDASRAGLTLTYNLDKRKLPVIGPLVGRVKDLFKADTQTASADQHAIENVIVMTDEPAALAEVSDVTVVEDAKNMQLGLSNSSDDSVLQIVANPETAAHDSSASFQAPSVANDGSLFRGTNPTALLDGSLDMATYEVAQADSSQRSLLGGDAFDQKSDINQAPDMAAALPAKSEGEHNYPTPKPVLFHFDSNEVTPIVQDKLQPLVQYMNATPDATVTLTGHTDSVGTEAYNQALSLRRAEAVRRFLLQQGIDRKMIRILGAGEKRPAQSNATKAGRKANRRVSMVVD